MYYYNGISLHFNISIGKPSESTYYFCKSVCMSTYHYALTEREEASVRTDIQEKSHLKGIYTSPHGRKVGE